MKSIWQTIYDRSPVLIQNMAISLYGLQIYFREYGQRFDQKLAEAERLQWLSPSEMRAWQDERLTTLITHCYTNVPYYRELMTGLKLKPSDIRTVADLPKLPVLTRDDIVENFQKLQATTVAKRDQVAGSTSGTTGTSLQLIYDREVCLMKTVVDWRQKRWAGLDVRDRFTSLLGHFIKPTHSTGPPFSRRNYVLNNQLFSVFHMTPDNMAIYLEELRNFGPVAIEGYPSTVFIMAKYILSQNRTLPVKAVFTSSETLYDYQREAIEKAFECRVLDYYGMAERVIYATECEKHEGNHLNEDFGLTEIIKEDGGAAHRGEIGRIVATGLHNHAMPLIRYQTSDVTALREEVCSCGRGFPLLQNITTKAEDIVTTRSGRYVSPSLLNYPFDPMDKVAEAQYLQEDLDNMTIRLVKLPQYDHPRDTQKLLDEMKVRIGDEMNITVEFVDEIERTAAGKFRCVVSKVPLRF